jgi:dTDP-4-dehydrorhamnose 3,5-epimerase
MNVTNTDIDGVLVIEPRAFVDDRGVFFESFNQRRFSDLLGEDVQFVQDNHSHSKKGVLRGLHYQSRPHAQGKLVRVAVGEVFDVAVDIRAKSPTFGRWVGVVLSERNKKQLWMPPGIAHGFLTLSETADFLYKTTDYYFPELERSIRWDDPKIAIGWPERYNVILSAKDANSSSFSDAELF